MLAAAGLLDERKATTHWMHADDLRRGYPRVTVDERALYIDEGDVLTSAGTAAGIDMCLALHSSSRASSAEMAEPAAPHRGS
ncbi:DJ-1/PfpI family protein [Amycolatopsis sp. cmx-11-51]|uniref:DJ-1/PfpI family protein n=1 Tax=Amycolatopsis sp. cmx-11-51 TaxID=2785797 RepID=UPI0039E69DA3